MDVFNLARFGWPKRWSESESMIAPWQELEPLSTDAHPRDVPASLWRKPLDERMGVALRGWKSKGISLWINFFTAFLRFSLVTASTLMIVWELALRWLDCLRWKHLWFNALLLAAWQKLSCASEVDIDFIWFYHIPWRSWRYRTVDTVGRLWAWWFAMLSPKTRSQLPVPEGPCGSGIYKHTIKKPTHLLEPCEIPQSPKARI